jgi:hypothetical protein
MVDSPLPLFHKHVLSDLCITPVPALDCGIRHGNISKYIHNPSHRLHPPVNHLAIQTGEVGSIARNDQRATAVSTHHTTDRPQEITSGGIDAVGDLQLE